jgi:hypothetical protein
MTKNTANFIVCVAVWFFILIAPPAILWGLSHFIFEVVEKIQYTAEGRGFEGVVLLGLAIVCGVFGVTLAAELYGNLKD